MKIGELSKKTGVNVDTLRFYAKRKLLNYSHKNRYWDFSEDQILLAEHILFLRSLNFSINDIHYIFHASEDLLDGSRVQKEKVIEYKHFFEEKLEKVAKQKEDIEKAEMSISKILAKLSYLENEEMFTL